MAPSAGHLHKLIVRNIKLLKSAWKKTLTSLRPAEAQLQPVRVPARQPVHPITYLRQNNSRWYTTTATANASRQFTSATSRTCKVDRASFPKSRTASFVNRLTGRAPFSSTLRPNLTGGALRRTAGGYALGSGRVGGARYFSHTPSAPAQVIQNVSQAVRAFWLSGQKAQFNGINSTNGEKRYSAVSTLQEKTQRKMLSIPKATPGSYVEFKINPTITALTPLSAVAGYPTTNVADIQHETLHSEGLLDVLSVDFSRALQDLAAVLSDIKRLTSLGDLPITCSSNSALRIHFPGCDGDTVEKLCQEIGVRRGVITQDDDFDDFVGTEIALLFPYAPSKTHSEVHKDRTERYLFRTKRDSIEWQTMLSEMDDVSTRSQTGIDHLEQEEPSPWGSQCSLPEGYESMNSQKSAHQSSPLEYQDFEGIYRFIELCDAAKR